MARKATDVLIGGPGGDLLDGYWGDDTASYRNSDAGITIDLASGTGSGGHADGDTLRDIEIVWGSDYGDIIVGDEDSNVLEGFGGIDYLYGGDLADILSGGDDGDFLFGEDLNDTLDGGNGDDVLYGGDGYDIFEGGPGGDYMDGGADDDKVSYRNSPVGVTIDLLAGTGSGGHAADDVLVSIERVWGSDHADVITGSDGDDSLYGFPGDDIVNGGNGIDYIQGDTGDDTINGGDGDDDLSGEGGSDLLIGGEGADRIIGGNDNRNERDMASYEGSDAAVTIDLTLGWSDPQIGGHAEGDVLANIEDIRGSDHDDTITGDRNDNLLEGGDGADLLYGRRGDDVLVGGIGADALDGGRGFDIADYGGSFEAVNIDLGNNVAVGGEATDDILVNIEKIAGSAHGDILIGDENDNVFEGGGGDDYLAGNAGLDTASYAGSAAGVTIDLQAQSAVGGDANGDTLVDIENVTGSGFSDDLSGDDGDNVLKGLAGNDTLEGGDGADVLKGGGGEDTALYRLSGTGITIDLESNVANGGHATGDTLLFVEHVEGSDHNDVIAGDGFGNTLKGHDGSDDLFGGDGHDTLIGGDNDDDLEGEDGDDTLVGGAGADDLVGGEGMDTADYAGSSSGITVDLAAGTGLGGDAEGDRLDGVENLVGTKFQDTLTGNAERNFFHGGKDNDVLDGGGGWDVLSGEDGADLLIGGQGNDTLLGGADSDTFVFTVGSGRDWIGDFETGQGSEDVLLLDGLGFGSFKDVEAASYQDGADTVIDIDADTSITLLGVDLADLHDDNFLFI